jgi:hypothetical protein
MFVRGRAEELVFLRGMFLSTYAADNRILRMSVVLRRVAKGPAVGALLNQRKRLETLGANTPTKHEEGRLQDVRGGLAILIKKGEGNRPVTGLCGYIGLQPTGVREECDAGAEHIAAKFGPELVRARKGT